MSVPFNLIYVPLYQTDGALAFIEGGVASGCPCPEWAARYLTT